MAPCAEALTGKPEGDGVLAQGGERVFASEHDLPEDAVAIDGVVYSLRGWNHPGGDQILLFGGNDVSVQYRMIHPFHAPGVVGKMPKIGVLESYRKDYSFGSKFEKDLIEAVGKVVKPNQRFATPGFCMRLVFYISLYSVLMYSYVVYGSSWLLCAALGVSQALIGLNVQHDANHGAISRFPVVNEILGFGADLIGGSKYLWLQQHWTHHAYTNDIERDPDAKSCDPFFLFHNYPHDSPMRKAFHAFQHFWMLPILSFYWLSSIVSSEAISVTHISSKQGGMRFENSYLKNHRIQTWLLRAFYLACTSLSPFYHHQWHTALLHVWFMSVVESLSLAIPFALSHNFEDAERHPLDAGNGEPVDWYKSQVETSSTYGGKVAGWITGGLNFQVEHHLFPRMSSAWYPYIQPVVSEVCKKHGVRYAYYPSFFHNLFSTVKYIRDVGTGAIAMKKKN
ncbi:hypothetical protein GUITHDRAFT_89468 [Guillardia theta CCMP2712]|uniref:Fatty acid desaturase domain-containing protein n=2 Tax=Guillardia theta TaxID=55529 RepID=L1IPI2_GUITC|nr:hypothetical protein GUITHDRAFT_89468 [Guillardia theta CCMP2712]EKX38201.1 hypothetical protein GUITHDRAFT_89468 [Guillardia theta CCMP2712]|eukprot:XP_005825181.1 hypothetical protein GUITHDRAFT_89468 [Guillardia theta CCMP2712]